MIRQLGKRPQASGHFHAENLHRRYAIEAGLPAGSPWSSDADFAAITAYFQPPAEDEKFNVVRHERRNRQ